MQTGSEAHLAYHSVCIGAFLRGGSRPESGDDQSVCLVPRLKMDWAIPQLPRMHSWRAQEQLYLGYNFTSYGNKEGGIMTRKGQGLATWSAQGTHISAYTFRPLCSRSPLDTILYGPSLRRSVDIPWQTGVSVVLSEMRGTQFELGWSALYSDNCVCVCVSDSSASPGKRKNSKVDLDCFPSKSLSFYRSGWLQSVDFGIWWAAYHYAKKLIYH